MQKLLLIFVLLFTTLSSNAQTPSVGLKFYDEGIQDGYVLFTPLDSRFTFLIDNCGNLVNQWESDFKSNFSVYLLEDGSILKPTKEGANSYIEKRDWDDNELWKISLNTLGITQHHDIEPLPNGNILLIANDVISMQQAINAGKDVIDLVGNIIAESVYEIEPIGTGEANIVWEWHVWDHLIQDFDSTKLNYGIVENHPELIDVNYISPALNFLVDWLHFNSIDYNPTLDQILLSSRHNSEIYIIDHSTTSEEAASNVGGNGGKGGDILFRWGNPIVYRAGEVSDAQLFGQHHASWIHFDNQYENRISLFNNGYLRPDDSNSTIEILELNPDATGNYPLDSQNRFSPDSVSYEYTGEVDGFTIASSILSSAQLQPNGNFLICEGINGRFIEVDEIGNLKWHYQNPVSSIFFDQGDFPNGTRSFRAERYWPNHPAFIGKDLSATNTIEDVNENSEACSMMVTIDDYIDNEIQFYPNPFQDQIHFNSNSPIKKVEIYNAAGKLILKDNNLSNSNQWSTKNWLPGIYICIIHNSAENSIQIKKVIKQ